MTPEQAGAHEAGDCLMDCPHPDHEYEWRGAITACPDSPLFLRDLWEPAEDGSDAAPVTL